METMSIVVQREKETGDLVTGSIYVNGKMLGKTYENAKLRIRSGKYHGIMRYRSGHNFVQSNFGAIAHQGDFLLEIGGVKSRGDILFHGGNKAKHSQGCILLGAIGKDLKTQKPHLESDHPLRKLRTLFYGTDLPLESPDKRITVQVEEINACYL